MAAVSVSPAAIRKGFFASVVRGLCISLKNFSAKHGFINKNINEIKNLIVNLLLRISSYEFTITYKNYSNSFSSQSLFFQTMRLFSTKIRKRKNDSFIKWITTVDNL